MIMANMEDNNGVKKKTSIRDVKRYCRTCGSFIPKKQSVSWRNYAESKYCSVQCLGIAHSKRRVNANQRVVSIAGNRLPLSSYISVNTDDLREIADFYIGLMKKIKNIKDDAEESGLYKGMPIDKDLVKEARQFLAEYGYGKPIQKKDDVKEPEISRDEALAQLRGLEDDG